MLHRLGTALLCAITFLGSPAQADRFGADAPPLVGFNSRIHPEYSYEGMVASAEIVASTVGARILEQGGNAIDAAVATGFALAVTYPSAGNLGGGGFMMIHLAKTGESISIDYREMAPAAATRDMFIGENGEPDPNLSRVSLKSSGVPGTVAGLLHAHEKYGRLTRNQVMQPAIDLAENGIEMSFFLYEALKSPFAKRLQENPASRGYFFKADGSQYTPGEVFRQQDLAKTLRLIEQKGRDGFYAGPVADLIVAEMQRGGGLISHQDLADYTVVEREPIRGTFMGYDIVTMPPPSSGGIHLVQMLNILEGYPLKDMPHNSAAYLHLLTETMKRAYADRSKHLGDSDFYPVPAAELTSKTYAAQLREGINEKSATPSSDILPATSFPKESTQTTHYTVMDSEGNVVSNTYTLNGSFGNGQSVPGTGFLLNNEMDDFSAKPGSPNMFGLIGGEANAIEPRKRPLSSMTPTIVLKDGRPVMATGAPGGSRIITVVMQIVLNHLVYGMNIAEASLMPRIHHQWEPDKLFSEPGLSSDTLEILERMGHPLGYIPFVIGNSSSIAYSNGVYSGVSDTRRPGGAAISVESVRAR